MAETFSITNNGCNVELLDNQHYKFLIDEKKCVKFENPKTNEEKILENISTKFLEHIKSISNEFENINKENLILFNEKEYEHNTDDSLIEISGMDSNFELTTGNVIGFVKKDNLCLNITSRFGDDFLKYIIADADGFLEIKDKGGAEKQENNHWLLAYLWCIKLKKAYLLGLPKRYETKQERMTRVRGNIDTVDFFINKKLGKYLCTYREHSYGNAAIALFKKAYELQKTFNFCESVRSIYNACHQAIQGKKYSTRQLLEAPHFTNPYYQEYNVLIDLSKWVLKQNGLDIKDNEKSSAFLFDVSMLFEYFVRKLLKQAGFNLRGKLENCLTIPTGVKDYKRKLQPDFVIEKDAVEKDDEYYIFDAKYKNYDFDYGVKREDLFQLHTYIGQYGNEKKVRACGFIYPIFEEKLKDGFEKGFIKDTITQQNCEIEFYVIFLKIPKEEGENFNEKMKVECDAFIEIIQKITSQENKEKSYEK